MQRSVERYKHSKERTQNYKNIVSYGNKLLGFKLEPKTGQRIEVTPLAPAEAYIDEITNKHIKALVSVRKREKASYWMIKHELETLRGAIQLARDLGYQVNTDITDRCIICLTFLDLLHDGYGNDHFIPSRLERSTPPARI